MSRFELVSQNADYILEFFENAKFFFIRRGDVYLSDKKGKRLECVRADSYDDLTKTFVAYLKEGNAILVTPDGIYDSYNVPYKDIKFKFLEFSSRNEGGFNCKFDEIGHCGDNQDNSRPVRLSVPGNIWTYCSYSQENGFELHRHIYNYSKLENVKLGRKLGVIAGGDFHCLEYYDSDVPYIKLCYYKAGKFHYYNKYLFSDLKWEGSYISGTLIDKNRHAIVIKKHGGTDLMTQGESDEPFVIVFDDYKGAYVGENMCLFWGVIGNNWVIYSTMPVLSEIRFVYIEGEALEFKKEKSVFVKKKEGVTAIYDIDCGYTDILSNINGEDMVEEKEMDGIVDNWREKIESLRLLSMEISHDEGELVNVFKTKKIYTDSLLEALMSTRTIDWMSWRVYYYDECGESDELKTKYTRTFYVSSSKIDNSSVVLARNNDSLFVGQQLKHISRSKIQHVYCRLLFEIKNVPYDVFEFFRIKGKRSYKMIEVIGKIAAKQMAKDADLGNKENYFQFKSDSHVMPDSSNTANSKQSQSHELNISSPNHRNTLLLLINDLRNKPGVINGKELFVPYKRGNHEFNSFMKPFDQCPEGFNPFDSARRSYIRTRNGVFVLLNSGFKVLPDPENENKVLYEIPGEGDQVIMPGNANGAIINGRPVYLFYKDEGSNLFFLDKAVYCLHIQETQPSGNVLRFTLRSVVAD